MLMGEGDGPRRPLLGLQILLQQPMCHKERLFTLPKSLQHRAIPCVMPTASHSGYFHTTGWGKFCRRAEDAKQETLGVRGVQGVREVSS